MVETVYRTIGAGGDFATLAEFAAAVPPSLISVDQVWVALLNSDADDPGGATFRTLCDATRYVEVRAAPGQGFDDQFSPSGDPLAPTSGGGSIVRTGFGDALRAENAGTRVHLTSLQIVAANGAAVADDEEGAFVRIDRCLIDANTSDAAVTVRSTDALITNTGVIQRGNGDGVRLTDATEARNCTVVKPDRLVADGFGFAGEGSPLPDASACVAFGFRQAFNPGFGVTDSLVSDQTNVLPVSDNFADPYWQKIGATVDGVNTVPGPFNVPLQWVANNLNAFARLEASTAKTVQPGERIAFSAIVAQPTALVSGILLSSSIGNPEVRINWALTPPGVALIGQSSTLRLVDGRLDDLGNNAYRIFMEAENTSTGPTQPRTVFYVTRGVENSGLLVGMYAGALMAGCGNLGNGYVASGALPGSNRQEGVRPSDAIVSSADPGLDLRPVAGGPLDGVAPLREATDIYFRIRRAPDTIGPVSLNPGAQVQPAISVSSHTLDPARLIDSQDVLNAQRRRTVLPAAPSRRIGV